MPQFSRRSAMIASAIAAVSAGMKVEARTPHVGRPKKFGVQLYSFQADATKDLQGTLARIAAIGYTSVELPSFLNRTPAEIRAALDMAGLTCPSAHIQARSLVPGSSEPTLGGNLALLEAAATAIGLEYVVMPIFNIPDRLKLIPQPGETIPNMLARIGREMRVDDWKYCAEFLNAKGAAMKKLGLKLAYHNHNIEFTPIGTTCGFEILLEETDPELVWFEMDAGWIAAAGRDPLRLLQQNRGRFRLMHMRDIKRLDQPSYAPEQGEVGLGKGSIDWKALLPLASAQGLHNFIVEREPITGSNAFTATAADLAYLRSVPF